MSTRRKAAAAAHDNTAAGIDLPSIFQLGLLIVATDREHARLDKLGHDKSQAMDMLSQREEDLWHVIASMQPVTLADAAVQIGVGFHISGLLDACVWSGEDQQERLHQLHAALYRIHLSTLPLLAEAAKLDMEAMGWGQVASLRVCEMGGGEA